jgi:hypothetical protein
MEFRVAQGNKTRGDAHLYGDLILCWNTPLKGWQRVEMDAAFLIADFMYENENVLYPQRLGWQGGEKPLQQLRIAARNGYEQATNTLHRERSARAERQEHLWEEAGD